MGICNDDCDCNVEGTRGLQVDGIGTPGDPFTVTPEAGRTIPRTVATYADLPTLGAEEEGQQAFVEDTGLLYVWVISATTLHDGWQVVAPDWGETADASVSLPALGTPVNSDSLDLRAGRWDVIATGFLDANLDPDTYLAVAVSLVDLASLTSYDLKIVSVWNDALGPRDRAATFTLQRVVSSGLGSASPPDTDKSIVVRMQRLTADTSAGAIERIKIRAVRVASHSVF